MMRQVCSRFLLSFRRPVGRLVSRARACACRLLVLLLGFVCDFFRLAVAGALPRLRVRLLPAHGLLAGSRAGGGGHGFLHISRWRRSLGAPWIFGKVGGDGVAAPLVKFSLCIRLSRRRLGQLMNFG